MAKKKSQYVWISFKIYCVELFKTVLWGGGLHTFLWKFGKVASRDIPENFEDESKIEIRS